jgi:hypothetical protein
MEGSEQTPSAATKKRRKKGQNATHSHDVEIVPETFTTSLRHAMGEKITVELAKAVIGRGG